MQPDSGRIDGRKLLAAVTGAAEFLVPVSRWPGWHGDADKGMLGRHVAGIAAIHHRPIARLESPPIPGVQRLTQPFHRGRKMGFQQRADCDSILGDLGMGDGLRRLGDLALIKLRQLPVALFPREPQLLRAPRTRLSGAR